MFSRKEDSAAIELARNCIRLLVKAFCHINLGLQGTVGAGLDAGGSIQAETWQKANLFLLEAGIGPALCMSLILSTGLALVNRCEQHKFLVYGYGILKR